MDRDFWESFLNTYKIYPALWNTKHPDYGNRTLREQAYSDLVELCRTKYPQANRDFVAKKIHHFRCSFRREYKKVITSQRSERELYIPSLWYYNLLLFIIESENQRPKKNLLPEDELTTINGCAKQEQNNNADTDNYEGEDEEDDGEITSLTAIYDTTYDGNIIGYHQVPSDSGRSSIKSNSIVPIRNIRKRRSATAESTTVEQHPNVGQFLEYTTTTSDSLRAYYDNQNDDDRYYREDEFDIAGKKLALDLRSMDYKQRIFAEKLIAEVIFYAKLGKLNENCRVQP